MLSPAHTDLGYSLAKLYFSDQIALVLRKLFDYDHVSFRILRIELPELKRNDIKRSLLILVKYQLVDYVKTVKNFSQQYEYSVVPQRVFAFFRLPKYVQFIKSRDENVSQMIISMLAQRALVDKDVLVKGLVKNQPDDEAFKSRVLQEIESLKLSRHIVEGMNNLGLNIERLDRDFRDNMVINTIFKFYNCDHKIMAIAASLLRISHPNTGDDACISSPVPFLDLSTSLVPEKFTNDNELQSYLTGLVSEFNNRFIIPSGNHPVRGPMYALDIGSVIDYLVKEYVGSIITGRFGPKCCRVFRVLMQKGPLLLKQIDDIIMLPSRDVREYSYMLMKEGFIRNRQVPKTPDNAPSKSIFIMSVELDQVVYDAADRCCRSMNNLLVRYDHELRNNNNLLERYKAAKELLESEMSRENKTMITKDDWAQYFNSYELSQIDVINKNLNKLLDAKNQVDETLYILHTWLSLRPDLAEDADF